MIATHIKSVFVCAVASVALLLAAVSAGTAAAAVDPNFTLISCTRGEIGEAASALGWSRAPFAVAGPETWCPDGLRFTTDTLIAHGDTQRWGFSRWPAESVTMTVEDGGAEDGIRYSVPCFSQGCTPVELPERATGDPPSRITVPLPYGGLVIQAECMADACAARSPGMLMHDFSIAMVDDTGPNVGVDVSGMQLSASSVENDFEVRSWSRPGKYFTTLGALDDGVGVKRISLDVDESSISLGPWSEFTYCRLGVPRVQSLTRPCDQSVSVALTLDLSGVADGPHLLWLGAEDGFGNTSLGKRRFYIDGTAPLAPSELKIAGESPDGWVATRLTDVTWTPPVERAGPSASGLDRVSVDVDPLDPAAADPPPKTLTVQEGQDALRDLEVSTDGEWRISVWGTDIAGNESPKAQAVLRRDVDVPAPPILAVNDWVSERTLVGGYRQTWQPPANLASLESGICGHALTIDRDRFAIPEPTITLRGAATTADLRGDIVEGENFVHLRAISCAGRASATTTTELRFDATPPVVAFAGAPVGEWSRNPVDASLMAIDPHSGVAELSYTIDDGAPVVTSADQAAIRLDDGVHTVTYSARDEAGNTSLPVTETVRVDSSGPRSWFEPRDPAHPVRLTAAAGDVLSGVAAAWLEIRRVDAGATADEARWRPLGNVVRPDAAAEQVRLGATVPEDSLADGTYEVHIIATDRVGNASSSLVIQPGGGIMRFAIPLRERPTITVGLAAMKKSCVRSRRSRCTRGGRCAARGCVRRLVVDADRARPRLAARYGKQLALAGAVRAASGGPLAGAIIEIYARVPFGKTITIGQSTSGPNGDFTFKLERGPTREFTARIVGDEAVGSASATAIVDVAATLDLRVSKRALRPGETITFRGGLHAGSTGVPAGGKSVQLEFLNGSTWAKGGRAGDTRTDSRGRFTIKYAFTRAVDRPLKVRFRVAVYYESGWPFAVGYSPVRVVTVRP